MKNRPSMRLDDFAADVPLYREVRRRILDALARGEWQPGERLPNEADLAGRFGVAVSTVRAGVGELAAAGILIRRQGKGTYVARHDLHGPQFRFSNIYDSRGRKVSTTREITAMRRVRADRETARLLAADPDEPVHVHQVNAVLKIDGRPVAVMELVLPVSLFPRLRQQHFEHAEENLYSVYQKQYGITVLRMEERVSARTAERGIAGALKVRIGHPVLRVERVAYTFSNRPAEIRRRIYEGLEHQYLFTHERLD